MSKVKENQLAVEGDIQKSPDKREGIGRSSLLKGTAGMAS